MKKKSTRARLDQPVNRIEFNRFDPAVELGLDDGASGAPESTPEKKNRSKRSGMEDSHLRSSPNASSDAGSLGSGKKSSKKSEKATSARKAAEAAVLGTPKPLDSKSSKGSGKKSGSVRSKKSARLGESGASLSSEEEAMFDAVARGDLSGWEEVTGQLDVDPSFCNVDPDVIERTVESLVADQSLMPELRLGMPNTKRRDQALKSLKKALNIKFMEAEYLLTASSLAHPDGKQNAALALAMGNYLNARGNADDAAGNQNPPANPPANPDGPRLVPESVISTDGKTLRFDLPFPYVAASVDDAPRGRLLIISKKLPIPDEQREEFFRFVEEFDLQDHCWLNIRSSPARKLVLKDLHAFNGYGSHFEPEMFLQLSHVVYQRFVVGDDDDMDPAEHYAIACAIGQIMRDGVDSYRDDQWDHEPSPLNAGAKGASPSLLARQRQSAGKGKGASATPAKKVRAPVVPQGSGSSGGSEDGASNQGSDFDTASYLERLAAVLRAPRINQGANLPSGASNAAVDRAIEGIRRSGLPAEFAEAAINGLLSANDKLREVPKPPLPPKLESAAQLGRDYRLGALAAEDRARAHHVNRVGARVASDDGQNARLPADREARLNSDDREVLHTLRKVLRGGGEFSHLDSQQKMRAMSRLVRRQLHDADLERQSSAAKATRRAADEAEAARQAEVVRQLAEAAKGKVRSAVGGDGGGDGGSSSSGDSCSRSSEDSRSSGDTYREDDFCVRGNRGSGGAGDGDDGGDGSGGSVGSSSGDESGDGAGSLDPRDEKRAKSRRESSNSLGTPATQRRGKAPLATPAPLPAVEGDRPSLVLLGDEDLNLWKSGPAKYKMGFHWESYLYHKQQFDNYKAHRGRFSDRTFKSIIDAKLIPSVCSFCGFNRSKWAKVTDARLILRIERVLRPSKSTDFAMELKEIKLEHFHDEPLQTGYVTFAEKFLAKIAEAADAGRPIKPVVVKSAFKFAVDKELPLKTWLEGDKWRGVDHANKRLLRKLREARSWEAMTLSVKRKGRRDQQSERPGDDEPAGSDFGNRRNFSRPAGKRKSNAVKKRQGNATKAKKSNATSGGFGGKRDTNGGKREQRPQGEKLRTWKGCDSRGDCWHTDKELFDCFKKPCNAKFCQRCAKHGHTADYCQVPDGTEGLNASGYFQEQRPGKAGPKRPPARNNSSGKRRSDSDGSGSDSGDDAGSSQGGGGAGNRTSRRSNSTRGQRGRGRL